MAKYVIEIAEETKQAFDNADDINFSFYDYNSVIGKAIRNATPLPKGHGRLADLDAALECVNDDSVKDCNAKWEAIALFDWAMSKRVVIPADTERSE